jgi:hypothetical protein
MDILKQVPGSVLWLLSGQSRTNETLAARARESGVEPERLIFAPRLANPEHLARFALADVFLDTFPYGAHTTASDALFMGVPVLTRIGKTFAARVCSSLVAAAGLPDFICETREQYLAKAVSLATDQEILREVKRRLSRNRDTCVLFDMPSLVRNLERLFAVMRKDYLRNELPQPDLTSAEALFQVAIGLDHQSDQARIEQLIERYSTGLRQRGCRAASIDLLSAHAASPDAEASMEHPGARAPAATLERSLRSTGSFSIASTQEQRT